MQLDGLGGGAHAQLGSEELGHSRFLLERRLALFEPGGMIHELLGGFDFCGHVCEGEVHALEARDRPAELLPGGRVRQTFLERPLSQSERQGGDPDPAAVEGV